jgi:Na+/proline symporter
MSRKTYWVIVMVLLAFIVAGLILFLPSQDTSVNLQDLEQYYRTQYAVAGVIGIALGLALGWWATGHVYHVPGESNYNGRVAMRGALAGVIAAILSAIVAAAMAATAPFDPLAPVESVGLAFTSGLIIVVLSIAAVAAMIAYVVPTRAKAWGGQYALIKRL